MRNRHESVETVPDGPPLHRGQYLSDACHSHGGNFAGGRADVSSVHPRIRLESRFLATRRDCQQRFRRPRHGQQTPGRYAGYGFVRRYAGHASSERRPGLDSGGEYARRKPSGRPDATQTEIRRRSGPDYRRPRKRGRAGRQRRAVILRFGGGNRRGVVRLLLLRA